MNTANFYWEEAWFFYGQFLLSQNRDEEARRAFGKSEALYPNSFYAPYGRALLAAKQDRKTDALDALEKALDNFWPEPVSILGEPLLAGIRKTRRFQELMAKHFPPGWEKR